jgi:hypothetical protein
MRTVLVLARWAATGEYLQAEYSDLSHMIADLCLFLRLDPALQFGRREDLILHWQVPSREIRKRHRTQFAPVQRIVPRGNVWVERQQRPNQSSLHWGMCAWKMEQSWARIVFFMRLGEISVSNGSSIV